MPREGRGGKKDLQQGTKKLLAVVDVFIYLDCGDSLTGVFVYQFYLVVHFKYVVFILCPLYSKTIFSKNPYFKLIEVGERYVH